jgi:small-conductance mechanosensitive channel
MDNKLGDENKLIGFGKNLGIAIGVFISFYVIALLMNKLFDNYIEKNNKLTEVSKTLFYNLVKKMSYFVIISAGLLIAATQLGVNIGTLMVILGSIGLALALSLQEFLGQFVSGIVMLFFQYFKINDLVNIGGNMGIVTDFNLLNTTLTTPENTAITIPNSQFMSSSFVNYSHNKLIYLSAEICISNNAKVDYADLLKILDDEIKKISYVENGDTVTKLDSMSGLGTKILVLIRIKPQNYGKAKKELYLVSRHVMEREDILLCDNYYIK